MDSQDQPMTGVSLDTSGFVDNGTLVPTVWSDLSPFEQGYVAAAKQAHPIAFDPSLNAGHLDWALHHLARETLAAIRKDCGFAEDYSIAPWGRLYNANSSGGACFWTDRQAKKLSAFPPLTVTLGDDGKVRFQ